MQHTHRAVSSESRENAEQLLKLSVTSFLVSLSTELQQSCVGGGGEVVAVNKEDVFNIYDMYY